MRIKHRRWSVAATIAIVVAAVVVRVYVAWLNRSCTKSDFCIVGLMAKHMAEGVDFPLMLYGYAYGGSLEAIVASLFFMLFGCSSFVLSLATELCALPCLLFVYLWARGIGDRACGLRAAVLLVIGPPAYLVYSGMSVCGYAVMLSLVPALLWWTCRLSVEEKQGRASSWYSYAALGCVAGAGWWAFPLIFPLLITLAVVMMQTMGTRVFRPRIVLAGIAGFLAGSCPFWIWNYRNGWASFKLGESFERAGSWFSGIRVMMFQRLPAVLGLTGGRWCLRMALLAGLMAVAVLFALWCLRGSRKRASALTGMWAGFLFVAIHVIVLGVSHYAEIPTARYLLPLVPVLAVMTAVALGMVGSLTRPWIANLLVLLLVIPQFMGIRQMRDVSCRYESEKRSSERLVEFLKHEGVDCVYADYVFHYLNFMFAENICASDLRWERYFPYAARAEQADRVGVLNGFGHVAGFLAYAGGICDEHMVDEMFPSVRYGFVPPPAPGNLIDRESIAAMHDGHDADLPGLLCDSDLETVWDSGSGSLGSILIDLKEPLEVGGFLMICDDWNEYPCAWVVEGRETPGAEWIRLAGADDITYFFWSGVRPYWGGSAYRLACRFPVRGMSSLRIRCLKNRPGWNWRVAELMLVGGNANPVSRVDSFPALFEFLCSNGVNRVYSDRWLANRLETASRERLELFLEPSIYQGTTGILDSCVRATPNTAMVVERCFAGVTRRSLSERGLIANEQNSGPWTVFFDLAHKDNTSCAGTCGLCWKGFACLKGFGKQYSYSLVESASDLGRDSDASGRAIGLLNEACACYPANEIALRMLAERLDSNGENDAAVQIRKRLKLMFEPEVKSCAGFENGVEFAGCSLSALDVVRGESVDVSYYWKVPPDTDLEGLRVFVHFETDGTMFQDDHDLLTEVTSRDIECQPVPETFAEHRKFTVPDGISPGIYRIKLGLFHPGKGRVALCKGESGAGEVVCIPCEIHVR